MKIASLRRLLIVECIAMAMSASCMAQTTAPPRSSSATPSVPVPTAQGRQSPTIVTDFSDLVRRDGPAVVNISSTDVRRVASMTPLWPPAGSENDPFFRFFQQFSPNVAGAAATRSQSLGSGFIVSPDGYILTDANVIANATHLKVTLTDRRTFNATLVGSDPASGVALLKISAKNLPTVKIGTSSNEKAGQWVASIGSPYGFNNTATAGIVSNMTRSLPSTSYIPLIQTDMTESAGDAGSPLFNFRGDVIGIEAPIQGVSGSVQGLAFAIPIDDAMKVEQQLQQHGKAEHGHLGVTIQEVSGPLAQSFGLAKPVGALISSVERGGPSAKSGLRAGDVILQFNGVAVTDSTQLPVAVADLQPGTPVHLVYWRNHATHDTTVTLGTLSEATLASTAVDRATVGADGLTVRGLTSDERHQAGVTGGVRVEKSAGPAALAGIQPGDIILMVDDSPVSSVAQFTQKLAGSAHAVALLVQRNGQRIFLTIDVG